MSNENRVVNLDYLDREAAIYKNSKEQLKLNSEMIDKAIKDNTKKEVEDVQNAIKLLNEKVDKIMNTDFVKEKESNIKKSKEQMTKSIELASNSFFKVRKYILEKEGLTSEQKQEYIKKLYDKIIDKFMTKEERNLFERFILGNGIIIMGPGGMSQLGGGGGLGGMNSIGF